MREGGVVSPSRTPTTRSTRRHTIFTAAIITVNWVGRSSSRGIESSPESAPHPNSIPAFLPTRFNLLEPHGRSSKTAVAAPRGSPAVPASQLVHRSHVSPLLQPRTNQFVWCGELQRRPSPPFTQHSSATALALRELTTAQACQTTAIPIACEELVCGARAPLCACSRSGG